MKDCLIIGPKTAPGYKGIYELLRDNKLMVTERSIHFNPKEEDINCRWYSTMRWVPDNRIKLSKTYNKDDYPTYDNYDVIEVNNKKDIPTDYEGKMGVPITFFYWYPDLDYEILDFRTDLTLKGKRLFQRLIIRRKQL